MNDNEISDGEGMEKRAPTWGETLKLMEKLKEQEGFICREFIDAVKNHDRKKILEIADAVDFFRDKPPRQIVFVDRTRWLLTFAKQILETNGKKWTIRQAAEFVALKTNLPTPPDGFSALRRMCRKMGFPLAESRKRKKK